MNGPLEWYAAISGIIAAFMIAGDFGRRVTGFGFLLFVTASIAWIIAGLQAGTMPLAVQNGILLAINIKEHFDSGSDIGLLASSVGIYLFDRILLC